jgi:hypothetical protein
MNNKNNKRNVDQFIGKKGGNVKRCLKCREKDDKHKKLPHNVEKINARQKEKKYYKLYRKKKREENEGAYLAHNAEVMRNWNNNNSDHHHNWVKGNFASKHHSSKYNARERGIHWDPNLTDEICYNLMISPCIYCNFKHETHLNGLDRLDSMQGYELSNVVSCCKYCNLMKGSLDPTTFIKRCSHISNHFGGIGQPYPEVFPDRNSISYGAYTTRATNKNLPFTLTKDDFIELQMSPCYYCDKPFSDNHTNGLDRKENAEGYTLENCVSCCCDCNYLKGLLDDEFFIEQCNRISYYQDEYPIPVEKFAHIPTCMESLAKRVKHEIQREPFVVVTPPQPPKEKEPRPPLPVYVPKQREYTHASNLPEGCPIQADQIPKYCYFKPEAKYNGCGFCVSKGHPKQKELGKGDWTTSRSKKVSIEDKFKQLLDYLSNE